MPFIIIILQSLVVTAWLVLPRAGMFDLSPLVLLIGLGIAMRLFLTL